MQLNKISFASVLKQKAKLPPQTTHNKLQSLGEIFEKYENNPHADYTLFLGEDGRSVMKKNGSNLRTSQFLNSNKHSEGSEMFDSWIQKQSLLNHSKNSNKQISNIGKSLNLKENMKNHNQIVKDNSKNPKKIILNSKAKPQQPIVQTNMYEKTIPMFGQPKVIDKSHLNEPKFIQKSKQQQKSFNKLFSKGQESKPFDKPKQKLKPEPLRQIIIQYNPQPQPQPYKEIPKHQDNLYKNDELKYDLDLIDEQIIQLAYKYKMEEQDRKEEDQVDEEMLISQSFKNNPVGNNRFVKKNVQEEMSEDQRYTRRFQEAKMKIGGYLKFIQKQKQSLSLPYNELQSYKYHQAQRQAPYDAPQTKEDEETVRQSFSNHKVQKVEIPLLRFQTPRAENINIPYLKEVQSQRVPAHQQNQQKFNYLFPQKQQEEMPFVKEVELAQSINYLQAVSHDNLMVDNLQELLKGDDNEMIRQDRKSYEQPVSPRQIQFRISPKTENTNNQYMQKYMDVSAKESLVYTAQKPQIYINIPADFDEVDYHQTPSYPPQPSLNNHHHHDDNNDMQNVRQSSNFANLAHYTKQSTSMPYMIGNSFNGIVNYEQPLLEDVTVQQSYGRDDYVVDNRHEIQRQIVDKFQNNLDNKDYHYNAMKNDEIVQRYKQMYIQEKPFMMQNPSLVIKNQCDNKLTCPQSFIKQIIQQSNLYQHTARDVKIGNQEYGRQDIQIEVHDDLKDKMKRSLQQMDKDNRSVQNIAKQDVVKPKSHNSSNKSSPSSQYCLKKVYSSPKTVEVVESTAPATSNFTACSDHTLQLKKSHENKYYKPIRIDTSYLKIDTVAYIKLDCDRYLKKSVIQEEQEDEFKFQL